MYKKGVFQIDSNRALTGDVYKMTLRGDTQYITAAGQFVNIEIEGLYLRRPISVCDYDAQGRLEIVYKVVGEGTRRLSRMSTGDKLDLLTGLGNGYSIEKGIRSALLVGGGVGVPPLYGLAKRLIAQGIRTSVVLGFNKSSELFYEEEFRQVGAEVYISTADGSTGVKGFVTDAIALHRLSADYIYSCGPEPMLRALYDATSAPAQFSFEERMGCGFGVCMGCSCKTKYGYKRICKDGPVLKREEIVW